MTILSFAKPIRGPRVSLIVCRFAASFTSATACRSRSWAIRPATDDDASDGFDFFDLVPNSQFPPDELKKKLRALIDRYIERSGAQGVGREHPRRA